MRRRQDSGLEEHRVASSAERRGDGDDLPALQSTAFRPERWLPATRENFPGRDTHPGRWGFVGEPAEPETEDYYVGRRVPDRFRPRGVANPVRYCEPA